MANPLPWGVLLLLTCGCAGATHKAMPSDPVKFLAADQKERGIRYYGSSLYLLVYSNGKGGIVSKFLTLPDPSKPMSVQPYATLATLDAKFKFDKGMLTSSDANADETVIPKAIVKAAQQVAESFLKKAPMMKLPETDRLIPTPSLFKVVVEGGRVRFRGGWNGESIRTPIPEAKKS